MRVLYLVPDMHVGGAEKHVTMLMPGLDRERFEASVICIGEEGGLFHELEDHGIPARALHRSRRQALATLRDLVVEMRRNAPHVVITRGYNAELLGRLAARFARVPHSIVWNHGDVGRRPLHRRVSDRLLDRVTTAYFGVAEVQRDHLTAGLGYPAGKVTIIHNGIAPEAFDPTSDRSTLRRLGVDDDEPVVAIVAVMRPEKDHSTFLRGARLVLQTVPRARFLVIGDGPARPSVEDEARTLGIADRVVFAGARSDVPELLRAIDVFALSSTTECLPISLLEAMAAGRPAVCTDVGGIAEVIVDGRTGLLVPPSDPERMAAALVTLLADPARRQSMGRAARLRLEEEFSLDVNIEKSQDALLDVAASAVPRPAGRPLNLCVVLDETGVGGAEILLLDLFKQLDPDVVRPRLVCLRRAGSLAAQFRDAGFEVEVLDRSGKFDTSTLPRLVRSLRAHRTDAVLVTHHHRAALLLGRLAAKLAGVPVNVVAAHDMDLVEVGGRVLPKWAVATLSLSDALVLLSPGQGDYLHRKEGVGAGVATSVREVVIPNGILLGDPTTADARTRARDLLGAGPDDFVIGIVARLSAQKSHDVLLDAVARLRTTHPQARLVVVGGGDRELELHRLATSLGIAAGVQFLGNRADVPALLPAFDAFALSSVHEGVPIAVIEAMAAGLPVVATDCGSLRDMVADGEQGYVVPVGSSELLADRLALLAGDEDLRLRLGRGARERAEREFRIQDTAQRYERLITELHHLKAGDPVGA